MSANDEIHLKPCPFCGISPRYVTCVDGYMQFIHPPTNVACPMNLRKRGESSTLLMAPEDWPKFVRAWNRRAAR